MEKPIKKYVTFNRFEGHYDWCHPNEKQAQYVFVWNRFSDKAKELKLRNSFCIDIDYDSSYSPDSYSALALAYEIQDILSKYLYSSYKQEIDKIIEFLESVSEENDILKKEYDIEYAKYQIEYWQNRLNELSKTEKQLT